MTRALRTKKIDSNIYPVRFESKEVVEIENISLKETEVKNTNENRFQRYKKSLQKRARSIL